MSDENTEQQAKELTLEVAPIESITRAEIDCQVATAHQFKRSLAEFYKRAEAMVTVDQETAESCFYQLRRKDRNSPTGFKLIEGESIRMAEIVAANFGNLRSAVHVTGHTPTRVSVRAVCHDLETNNLIAVEKQAKTTYSDGTPYSEDMAITTTNALVSKALRDAIFRVVPKALIKPLKEKAKLVAFGTGAAFTERRHKAFAWATLTRKIPAERVLAVLGIKGEEDMTIEHLEILTGLKNAIMEGDQTADEAFPPLESESKPNFTHPAKKEQEQEKSKEKVAEPKKETTKPKAETKPIVSETVQAKPETKAPPAETVQAKPETKVEPAPVVKEEAVVSNVETSAPAQTADPAAEQTELPTTIPEPKPEPDTPAPAPEMSAAHVELKEAVLAMGFTWEDYIGWGKAALAALKKVQVADWATVPVDVAKLCVKNPKGVAAGIRQWKGKQ